MTLAVFTGLIANLFWNFVLILVGLLLVKNDLFIQYIKSNWVEDDAIKPDEEEEPRKLPFWSLLSSAFGLAFSSLFEGVKTRRPRGKKINVIHSILVVIGQLMILVGLLLILTEVIGVLYLMIESKSYNVNFSGF